MTTFPGSQVLMRNPMLERKSRLTPQGKAIAAALVLLDVAEGHIDDKAAGRRLRKEVGLQWSFLNCMQYLSGQKAQDMLKALPNNWAQAGRTKHDLIGAVALAAYTVANARSDGTMLCASHLAAQFKQAREADPSS